MRVSVFLALLAVSSVAAITLTSNEFDVKRVIPGFLYQGVTFTPNGDFYTTSGTNWCVFTNAANLPIGGTLSQSQARCGVSNVGATNIVSSQNGRIYSVEGYEHNTATFAATRRFTACGQTHGIAVDPRDGAIFVSSVNTGKVWRIPNPDNTAGLVSVNCAAPYFDGGAAGVGGFDQITVGPDGKVYAAGYTAGKFVIISAYSAATPTGTLIAAKSTINRNPDGISICFGSGNSFALVATTSGAISKFALTGPGGAPSYTETTIATDVGGYLDFTTVDPKGCIWGTTLFAGAQGMYRVTNKDGSCGCASAQVPSSCTPKQCQSLSQLVHTPVPPVLVS